MNRPPAFQFYPKDWMDFKVQRMSYEAQGIYMKMLCFMWNDSRDQCSMPNDDIIISKSLGITQKRWMKIREEIFYINDPIFKINGNKIISKRLKKEVKKLREYRRIQAEKGKKSALSRGTTVKPRLNHGATEGATGRQPEGNSSSSSSSSSSNNKKDTRISFMSMSFKNDVIFKWNELAQKHNLAIIKEIKSNSLRWKNLRARSVDKDFDFDLLIDMIDNSPFLLGKTEKPFFVFFDWIIKPTNYQKIIEGNYLDRQSYQKFSGIIDGIKDLKKEKTNESGRS